MNMKQACEIVYAGLGTPQIRCAKEINESQLGAGETMSQSDLEEIITKHFPLNQVAELNAKIGVEHVRTVDAERKNKNLVERMTHLESALNHIYAVATGKDQVCDSDTDALEHIAGYIRSERVNQMSNDKLTDGGCVKKP